MSNDGMPRCCSALCRDASRRCRRKNFLHPDRDFERAAQLQVSNREPPCRPGGWLSQLSSMKFLPLLTFAAVTTFTGCQTHYTRFTATNFEGTTHTEWIAEGGKQKVEQGYKIKAVERTTFGPDPVSTRYPNGWKTMVTGSTILFERVPKPLWLAELDGEVVVEEKTTTTKHQGPLK
jgi:hypothetical protein